LDGEKWRLQIALPDFYSNPATPETTGLEALLLALEERVDAAQRHEVKVQHWRAF
jgi:hypothetical protein